MNTVSDGGGDAMNQPADGGDAMNQPVDGGDAMNQPGDAGDTNVFTSDVQASDATAPADAQRADATPPPHEVDLTFCDTVVPVANGRLCAIRPSRTDAAILDTNGSGAGFGSHLVGVPADWSRIRGVWIHFVGSYGRPYDPASARLNSKAWYNEVLGQNYLLLVVAYDNSRSINGDICTCMSGHTGCHVDNCAGDVRREILEGVDHSSLIAVDAANGIYNRVQRLAAFLTAHSLTLPAAINGRIDWPQIMVSGHSQGTGHAYYLARNVGVRGACYLSGPFDNADMVNPGGPIADWFTAPSTLVNPSNMGAVVLTTDPYYSEFTAAWNMYMNLVQNTQWFEYPANSTTMLTDYDGNMLNPADPNAAHGASAGATQVAALRAQACFHSAAHIL